MSVTLAQASTIIDSALNKARDLKQMPQTVVVLDAGGHVVAAKREDSSGIVRFEIAVGKAYGALGMGWGSRTMMERAAQNPNFLTAIDCSRICSIVLAGEIAISGSAEESSVRIPRATDTGSACVRSTNDMAIGCILQKCS